jgi:DNA topoisomerase VI subunit B
MREHASQIIEQTKEETKIIIDKKMKEYSKKLIFLSWYLRRTEITNPKAHVIVLFSTLLTVMSIMPLKTNTCWK